MTNATSGMAGAGRALLDYLKQPISNSPQTIRIRNS